MGTKPDFDKKILPYTPTPVKGRIAQEDCKHEALQALSRYYACFEEKWGIRKALALLMKFCTSRVPLPGQARVRDVAVATTTAIWCPDCYAVIDREEIQSGNIIVVNEDKGKV